MKRNQHKTAEKRVLTVAEAADYLKIGINLTYRLVKSGEIPSRRLGRRWIIPGRLLDEWLNKPKA
jgi:excisionase family DNA binding protein